MRIEILKRICCEYCDTDNEMKECFITTDSGLMLKKILCLECFLRKEKEYNEK